MNDTKTEFYSYNLQDAIGLAIATIEEGPHTLAYRIDFHINDIAQYDPKHTSIKMLKNLKKQAYKYLKVQHKTVNDLK